MVLVDAQRLAQCGRFDEMLAICRGMLDASDAGVATLLDIGVLLYGYGFLTDARRCYQRAQALAPNDLRAQVNLANLARDASEHGTRPQALKRSSPNPSCACPAAGATSPCPGHPPK